MAFHKITYNAKHRFATLHNYGCTFRCPVCSYKLRSGAGGIPGHSHPAPERFLGAGEMKAALRSVDVDHVYFMGGEPTLAADLPDMLAFARRELGAGTRLGHTNGSRLPLPDLDGANVGFKAWDAALHREWTGYDRERIYGNFERAFRAGLDLRANIVFVPGRIGIDQIEPLAAWLASLSPEIPFHVMGYIPVPGQPWPRPTPAEMDEAVAAARRHLRSVKASRLSPEEALGLSERDDRFDVQRIA